MDYSNSYDPTIKQEYKPIELELCDFSKEEHYWFQMANVGWDDELDRPIKVYIPYLKEYEKSLKK